MADDLFDATAHLLEKHSIPYWVSHGSLLGIVRENRLLPWDHDIDFSVWKADIDKEKIRSIFIQEGFVEKPMCGDMDCLHFMRNADEKMIDISFYDVEADIASIRWAITSGKIIPRVLIKILGVWKFGESYETIEGKWWSGKNLILQLAFISDAILSKNFKTFLYDKLIKRLVTYIGYSYPVSMLKDLSTINYNGNEIPVPREYNQYLEETYGKDWRTPKQNYVWYEEATNLKTFDNT